MHPYKDIHLNSEFESKFKGMNSNSRKFKWMFKMYSEIKLFLCKQFILPTLSQWLIVNIILILLMQC